MSEEVIWVCENGHECPQPEGTGQPQLPCLGNDGNCGSENWEKTKADNQ